MNDDPKKAVLVLVKRGRPTDYTEELCDEICGGIMTGLSLAAICAQAHMPDTTTVARWLRIHSSFSLAYAHAREAQADFFADEIMAISDDRSQDWKQDADGVFKPDFDHINRAKLRVESRKWIAAKLKPQSYGERVEAHLRGEIKVQQQNLNINVDASAMTAEARELLRTAVLGAISPPRPTEEEDS